MQDLWQLDHQILLTISHKEFIKLNLNLAIAFLKRRTIQQKITACLAKKKIDKELKKGFKNTFKFSNNDIYIYI